MKIFFCLLLGWTFASLAFAEDESPPAKPSARDFPFDRRITAYEPSYAVLQKAAGDEGAARVHYSFKYCLAKFSQDETNTCRNDYVSQEQSVFYFSYTGEFDFYAYTRPSGPVINRLNNPAFHLRIYKDSAYSDCIPFTAVFGCIHLPQAIDWADLALEHRSNGQVFEVTNPAISANAQAAYASNNHAFFDAISRGSNYLSIEAKRKFKPEQCVKRGECNKEGKGDDESFSIYAKVKLYATQDSEVTWGPLAGKGVSISDYDRVKFLLSHSFADKSEAALTWTIGDKGLSTDSWEVDYLLNRDAPLPLYLKYHNGPMHTLSNYTQNQHYFGIGIKFTP